MQSATQAIDMGESSTTEDAKLWLGERLPALLAESSALTAGIRFNLRLPTVGSWTIDLVGPRLTCSQGERADADCTLELDGHDLMKIIAKPDRAFELYDARRIVLTGSVDAALAVVTFFHRLGSKGEDRQWVAPADPKDFVYNPLARGLDEDPYPVYEYLRRCRPVFFWGGLRYWLLSRYDDVRALLTDRRLTTDHRGAAYRNCPPQTWTTRSAAFSRTVRCVSATIDRSAFGN